MCSACRNVDWNKLGALLSGKMLQTVECTNKIDVDLVWECWLYATMMYQDQMYPQEFTTLVVRRLRKKQAWTKAKKFNNGHH